VRELVVDDTQSAFDVFLLSTREGVAAEAREFSGVVRHVIQVSGRWVEPGGRERRLALMGRDAGGLLSSPRSTHIVESLVVMTLEERHPRHHPKPARMYASLFS
jgi:hypothetical protein